MRFAVARPTTATTAATLPHGRRPCRGSEPATYRPQGRVPQDRGCRVRRRHVGAGQAV